MLWCAQIEQLLNGRLIAIRKQDLSGRRWAMDESKRHAVKFLEKEIRTYAALARFLSKKGVKDRARAEMGKILTRPTFYKERVREAKNLVHELKNPS